MEILKLINTGSQELKNNNVNSYRLDSEILLAKILKKKRISGRNLGGKS